MEFNTMTCGKLNEYVILCDLW